MLFLSIRCPSARPARICAALLVSMALLSGCATVQNPDPWEPMNRKTFAFNEGVDKVVLKPVATAYRAVVPPPVRTGVSNFFSNLGDPWSGINLMLQGRVKDGLSDLARFCTNSTVGILGVMDVASDWGMPRHGEGFGETLAAWGVDSGAYLVLPLFGPSDVRNTVALPVNSMASLQGQVSDVAVRNTMTALNVVDKRTRMLDVTKVIDDIALDKYLFVRDAYIQRRSRRDTTASKEEAAAPSEQQAGPD